MKPPRPARTDEHRGSAPASAVARLGASHGLAEQVARALRQGIAQGELTAGVRLVEDRLAAAFGVSKTPLREAYRILQAEGLVEILPRRGAFVAGIAASEAEELYEVRLLLASHAVERAVERREWLVPRMRKLMEEMRAARRARDVWAFSDRDMAFHRLLAEASGNTILLAAYDALNPRLMRLRLALRDYKGEMDSFLAENALLLEAAEGGEAGRVREALGRLMRRRKDVIAASIRGGADGKADGTAPRPGGCMAGNR